MRFLRDLELRGRRVFLRADLNVPLDRGRISDRTRIEATLPSLRFVLERSGRLLLIHAGPEHADVGRATGPVFVPVEQCGDGHDGEVASATCELLEGKGPSCWP